MLHTTNFDFIPVQQKMLHPQYRACGVLPTNQNYDMKILYSNSGKPYYICQEPYLYHLKEAVKNRNPQAQAIYQSLLGCIPENYIEEHHGLFADAYHSKYIIEPVINSMIQEKRISCRMDFDRRFKKEYQVPCYVYNKKTEKLQRKFDCIVNAYDEDYALDEAMQKIQIMLNQEGYFKKNEYVRFAYDKITYTPRQMMVIKKYQEPSVCNI